MEDQVREKFQLWTQGCDQLRSRIALFDHVRDISYAYPASRDPLEVLSQNRGSCSGKHYLLGQLFRMLGLNVRHIICTHRFNEAPIVFPDDMQEMLRKNEIVDLHDYIQIAVGDEWIDVDATWGAGLRSFGFPVTEEWDGVSSMALTVVPDDLSIVEKDPERLKDEMLSRLTPRQRTLRKQFLEALSRWVTECQAELLQRE